MTPAADGRACTVDPGYCVVCVQSQGEAPEKFSPKLIWKLVFANGKDVQPGDGYRFNLSAGVILPAEAAVPGFTAFKAAGWADRDGQRFGWDTGPHRSSSRYPHNFLVYPAGDRAPCLNVDPIAVNTGN